MNQVCASAHDFRCELDHYQDWYVGPFSGSCHCSYNFTSLVDNGTNKERAMETPRRFGVGFSAGSCQHAGFYGVVTASVILTHLCFAERFRFAKVYATLGSTLQTSSVQVLIILS